MPTIHRYKGFRFHFYSNEGHESPHVHIRSGEDSCKFWFRPIILAYNDGIKSHLLLDLRRVVRKHVSEFERRWNEHLRQRFDSS